MITYMSLQFSLVTSDSKIREYTVEGTTFAPEGTVRDVSGKDASPELRSGPIKRLAEIGALCNDAKVVFDEVCSFAVAVITFF